MLLSSQVIMNRALSIFKQTHVRLNTIRSLIDIMGRSEKNGHPSKQIDSHIVFEFARN